MLPKHGQAALGQQLCQPSPAVAAGVPLLTGHLQHACMPSAEPRDCTTIPVLYIPHAGGVGDQCSQVTIPDVPARREGTG